MQILKIKFISLENKKECGRWFFSLLKDWPLLNLELIHLGSFRHRDPFLFEGPQMFANGPEGRDNRYSTIPESYSWSLSITKAGLTIFPVLIFSAGFSLWLWLFCIGFMEWYSGYFWTVLVDFSIQYNIRH